jgi:hypothetical protein
MNDGDRSPAHGRLSCRRSRSWVETQATSTVTDVRWFAPTSPAAHLPVAQECR